MVGVVVAYPLLELLPPPEQIGQTTHAIVAVALEIPGGGVRE
jgi:hypothetical protein